MTPQQLLDEIRLRSVQLVRRQYEVLSDILLPALAEEHIHFLRRNEWNVDQRQWLSVFYHREIVTVLTPLTLEPSRPFPKTLNKSLNFSEQNYTENDDPQPQVVDAFGLRMTNCAPCRSSL